ncbi:MAG: nicotinate-nucleotide adenylyltransferase [Planctomycetota bacterium]|jgi:nicotinate-nucleotide adenylyltransferase
MRRGVFGGSFDPVHVGHITVSDAAAAALGLGIVHLVPAYDQPFKSGEHRTGPEHRLAMLECAVVGHPRLVADEREIRRGGVSYTVDTLREMSQEYPADSLSLLIGADAATDLPNWRDVGELTQLARIVALTRPGVALPDHPMVDEYLTVPAIDVSATEIRRRVACGEPIADLVPPAVAAYIASHGLYRT